MSGSDTRHTLQLSTCGRHRGLHFIPAAPVFDTDLISLIGSQSPPLRGQFKGEGEACRAQIYAWCPGSSRSFCLPDHVQDLHHLLVDDENYGHIQAHSAQPGNCPFIETTDEYKEEKQVSMKIIVSRRSRVCSNWHLIH